MYFMYWIKFWKQPMSYFTTHSDPQWFFNLINPQGNSLVLCTLFQNILFIYIYIWMSMHICMLRFDFLSTETSDY